jgi:hypothetical protein
MAHFRLLVLALLSVCVAPLAAQTASAPLSDVQADLRLDQIQRPIDIDKLFLSYPKQEAPQRGEYDWNAKAPSQFRKRVVAQRDVTCLSIRSYRVTRDDPSSDTTRLVGYSTCQPSTRFQVKQADDRQEIKPR